MRLVPLLIVSALPLALPVPSPAASPTAPRGVPAENIDRAASPCGDFDAYANGQWRATHPMPDIQTRWAIRSVTEDETRARLRSIAEDDAAKASTQPKGSPAQLVGDFYAACIDQAHVDSLGQKPLEPLLHEIDGVRDGPALSAEMTRLEGIGISAPVNLSAMQDLHDTTQMIAAVGIGGLGLPDRDYSLRDEPRFKDVREKYRAYIHRMLVLAGSSDDEATRAVTAVLAIETALAKARLSRVELRDPKASDHPMSFAELQALAPHFDWAAEFRTLGVPTTGRLNVGQPKLVQAFDGLLVSTPLGDWRAYLRWHLLDNSAPNLAASFDQLHFGFHDATLSGAKEQRPRWQRCVIATDRKIGEALGHEYVDRYLPPEAKARARTMAQNIVDELKLSI
ncbi:MAG TPA: M13 family metallopeptidase N-terminal domain-containing protein, partial [Thermoanaerobaculia bacterium]